ncbi:phosphotransferase [Nocardia xishanensis]
MAGALSGTVIPCGKSNPTYEVTDRATRWIVRRPPLGHVLATAHDMAREYRVMAALRHADVPVPAMYALCQDDTVVGAPFYVVGRVEGMPYGAAAKLTEPGPERTKAISTRLVETLAALYAVDPAAKNSAMLFGDAKDRVEDIVKRARSDRARNEKAAVPQALPPSRHQGRPTTAVVDVRRGGRSSISGTEGDSVVSTVKSRLVLSVNHETVDR